MLQGEEMENELERRLAAAMLQNERWERSFSQVHEGVFIIDSEFKILQCNRAFAELVGGKPDGLVGDHCYSVVHGLTEAAVGCVTCAAIKQKKSSRAELYEPHLHKHLEAVADPILDDDGELVYAVHIIRDITEKVELAEAEKELAAAEAAAAEAGRNADQLKDLIDLAAHELRHPATVFTGYSTLLLEMGDELDEETVREALLSIEKASKRLAHLVTTLLDTSNIGHGRMQVHYASISPRSILIRAIEGARQGGTDRVFNISVPEEESQIEADPELAVQVLSMLIDNAIKFSSDCTIDVLYRQYEGETVFVVADRGDGVPEADRELVFDRFYQVTDVSHHSKPGMGLGLFIAREIVLAHGGWIRQDPREGGGSAFSFALLDVPAQSES